MNNKKHEIVIQKNEKPDKKLKAIIDKTKIYSLWRKRRVRFYKT